MKPIAEGRLQDKPGRDEQRNRKYQSGEQRRP
jgi:hypothetical protein